MSKIVQFEEAKQIVRSTETDFRKLAAIHGAVNFEKEQTFAIQLLKDSDYLCQVAYQNKDSLKMAVINVAAIGLSLNPVAKLAYLVPRDGKVCLDISWMGYVQLAVDANSIRFAKAEVVYEKDVFIYQGLGKEPKHEFNPFQDRGKIVGAYCVAVTHRDDYLTTMMPIDEIYSIRDRYSKSWQSHVRDKKKSPWASDEGEMLRKTVTRRAYKSWPMTDTLGKQRLSQAIALDDDIQEIEVGPRPEAIEANKSKVDGIRDMIVFIEKEEPKFVEFLNSAFQRKIESLEELTDSEIERAEIMLKGFVDIKLKEKARENENTEAS